jgi:type IV pilus assembly protein PilY1
VKRTDNGTDPVLVMGGGYDNDAEDGSSPGTTTKGKGVYVINMRTGARLAHLVGTDMESVPSDVSLIDTDGDGYVDRGYVIDVRANVYRIDIESSTGAARDPSSWVITKIANFNDAGNTRRVFFAPDVVLTNSFVLLMLGTGDREKPLLNSTNDRFYIMKDRKVSKGEPSSVTLLSDASALLVPPKLVPISETAAQSDPDGCYLDMAKDGEKVINQPITFGGITYFSSSKPSAGSALSCSTTKSKAYQIPLLCRGATSVELVGDGLPPSPVVGYVDVGGGKVVPFVIGGPNAKKSAIEVNRAQITIPGNRRRSYWFMDNRDR